MKEEVIKKLEEIFVDRFQSDYGDECENEVFDEDFKEYVSEIIWEDFDYDLLVEFSDKDWDEIEDRFYELRDEELRNKEEGFKEYLEEMREYREMQGF